MRVDPYPPYVDFLVVLLAVVLSQQIKKAGVPQPAQYVVTATWDARRNSDVDLYAQRGDRAVFFRHREDGVVFLDRDSRGFVDDARVRDGVVEYLPHRETISIRGIDPGVYDFGLHLYAERDEAQGLRSGRLERPLIVHVEVIRINPRVEQVYSGDQVLTSSGEAVNFWSMRVDSSGDWAPAPTPIDPFPLKYLSKESQ